MAEGTAEIRAYLEKENKPFTISDLMNKKITKDLGRTIVQRAVDELICKEIVAEKTYNKRKVYYPVQKESSSDGNLEDEIKALDREINQVKDKYSSVHSEYLALSRDAEASSKEISLEEARKKEIILKKEIEVLLAQLSKYQSQTSKIDEISTQNRTKIVFKYDEYVKEYKKRKRLCMDMLEAILEGYPKTKKDLYEDIGIETDEDAGFVLKAFKF